MPLLLALLLSLSPNASAQEETPAAPVESLPGLAPEAAEPEPIQGFQDEALPRPPAQSKKPSVPTAKPLDPEQYEKVSLAFLKSEVERGDLKSDETLLRLIAEHLDRYRGRPDAAEALWLRFRIHDRQEHVAAQLVDALAVLTGYPDSPYAVPARNRVQQLASKKFKKQADKVVALSDAPHGMDLADRQVRMLETLASVADERLAAPLRGELEEFLRHFPDHPKADTMVREVAHTFALEDDAHGQARALRRLLTFYPASPLRAEARVTLADLYAKKLRDPELAAAEDRATVVAHPDSPEALEALEHLADLQENKLGKHEAAAETLGEIAESYAGQPAALKALKGLARVQRSRLRKPVEAVQTLNRLADMFKGDEAVAALKDAADIALDHAKDPDLRLANLGRIVSEYGDRVAAAEAQYQIGETYFYELKDLAAAEAAYKKVGEMFSESPYASRAAARIEKIKKKRAAK